MTKDSNEQRSKKKNWFEWVVFSVGFVLVASVIGYLLYDMATSRSGPPQIVVNLGEPTHQDFYYSVPVEVNNLGQRAAEQVQIEVVLRDDGTTETGEFLIPHLPRGATRNGAVTFTHDPAAADEMEARVLGYQRP